MKIHQLLTLLLAAALLPACNDKPEEPAQTGPNPLDAFLSAEALPDARQISEIFADPVPGKEIVLAGEVMGRMEPFVNNRAMVLLGDPTQITPCNRIPGDQCPTPWDNCCDDREVLKKSITTIQFLNSEGGVIKAGLKGYNGIKELSYITVKGTIAEGSNPNNLLINAKAFHVTDPSPYVNAPPAAEYEDPCHTGEVLNGTITEDEDGTFIFTKDPEEK